MEPYRNEYLYIAGPMVFYTGGNQLLLALRRTAESRGFSVSLPNDNVLKLDNEDIRLNADAIFGNCAGSMVKSTAILADLEPFRGAEPDGGTVFEIGMAYALGLPCYAYTRDKRGTVYKYTAAHLEADGQVHDEDGRVLPYWDLPFGPCLVGSCKIVEGAFGDCLSVFTQDLEEKRKLAGARQQPAAKQPGPTVEKGTKPRIYLAVLERYDNAAAEKLAAMKKLCEGYGFEAVSPLDPAPGVPETASDDPYAKAYNLFDRWQQHVRNCDVVVGDLNDFHGWEPNSDVSFEMGMAWQLGKKCFGYMADTSPMQKRIPHYGPDKDTRDICGCQVEDFNYPINLMFASSMPVLEGGFEAVMAQVAEACKKDGIL